MSIIKYKRVCAIIAAAGNSTRMNFNNGNSKQFIEIGNKTVIERTVTVFNKCRAVDEVIIVARKEDISEINKITKCAGLNKVGRIIEGGNTRQESIFKAVESLGTDIEYIAVHDGARCFITVGDIEKVISKAFETGAATASTKVTDTVKYANAGNIIVKTIDREFLWAVQTPQIFLKDWYISGMEYIKKNKLSVTDDCSVIEYAGYNVNIVECSKTNIKITDSSDLLIAETLGQLL